MAQSTTIEAKDLAPWTPDIDPRRGGKPGIISGTNFIDDVDGPRSAFSSTFVSYNLFDVVARAKVNELRTASGLLYGTPVGVWRINDTSKLAELILPISVAIKFWPWTIAYVGGLYYLAQYDVGLWEYDPDAETMRHVATPAGDSIRGVAASFGRLVYLTPDNVAFSALDDGTDLEPSLITGASAQPLAIVGGTAYRIAPLADGFLVYMSEGILRATFVQAAYVFTFKSLTGAVKVFSPNAGIFIPGVGDVSLDASGFWLAIDTVSEPTPWEEEKGDYIKKNIMVAMNKTLFGTIDMYFSIAEQKLFVGFSNNIAEGFMQTTFVYTLISKRWSSFNQFHYGIYEVLSLTNNIYSCAYMDADGYSREFSNTDFTLDIPEVPLTIRDFLYRPTLIEREIITFIDTDDTEVNIAITEFNFSDNIPTAYSAYSNFGLYYINYIPYSDTSNDSQNDPPYTSGLSGDKQNQKLVDILGNYLNVDTSGAAELYAIPYMLPKIGLNSVITIGPFRFTDQAQADETSCISSLIVGLAATSNFTITEDWNILSGNEDWNVENGTEDWGSGNTLPNVFSMILSDTDDGINSPIQGDEFLPIFKDLGSSLQYAPIGYSSSYHNLTLSALNSGEAFALKFCFMAGQLTGRLSQS